MFDLINFLCENLFGSTSMLTDESFQYLSIYLRSMLKEMFNETFLITLKSRRTRLIVDDFKTIVRCRSYSILFGYTIERNRHRSFQIVIPREILLHVEWLAINGEQIHSPIKSTRIDQSILRVEQQMFFSFLQSNRFDSKDFSQIFADDHRALDISLSSLTDWFRMNLSDCLLHNIRREKRRQLIRHLSLIETFLKYSSTSRNFYLSNWLSMFITCLFYRYDDEDQWEIRSIAARGAAAILKRSDFLLYDVFYLRTIARLIKSIRNDRTPTSLLYAIFLLFEQLGNDAVRVFLLPQLIHIEPSKLFSSNSIRSILERFAMIFNESF